MSYSPNSDYALEVSKGNIPGTSCVNKFGARKSVTADTQSDIWPGSTDIYSFPATALITSMSQTTNQAAMLSAVIDIEGLDASWNYVSQQVALSAVDTTTAVTLATPLMRCYRAAIHAAVVSTSPIRIHNVGETVDYAIIETGLNQTLMAIYTVPAGTTAYMTSFYASNIDSTGKTAISTEIILWGRDNLSGHEFQVKHADGIPEAGPGFQHFYEPYKKFVEKTDIKVSALCDSQDGHVHAGFDLYLVDN